jgi:hypothetical protein
MLPDQGSNLDFLESKSSVLPVTPSGNTSKSAFLIAQGPNLAGKGRIISLKKNRRGKNLGGSYRL